MEQEAAKHQQADNTLVQGVSPFQEGIPDPSFRILHLTVWNYCLRLQHVFVKQGFRLVIYYFPVTFLTLKEGVRVENQVFFPFVMHWEYKKEYLQFEMYFPLLISFWMLVAIWFFC